MDKKTVERPSIVEDKHLEYLDDLRESGITNMYGSPAYIQREFRLSFNEACTIVTYWMKTFSERHRNERRA